MKKVKIGFFGGCFNPPTNTHVNLANSLIENNILDKVIFVPVGDYYTKTNLIQAAYRYDMLKLACKKYQAIEIENIAIKSTTNLYASDTFELIYQKYNNPRAEIYFIMGSDNFKKMPNWKNFEEIIKKYKYIVIERPEFKEEINIQNIIYCKLHQEKNVTSTQIRSLIKNNVDVTEYLDSKVYEYIQKNNLYK